VHCTLSKDVTFLEKNMIVLTHMASMTSSKKESHLRDKASL